MRGYKGRVPPCGVLAADRCKEQNAAEHLGPQKWSCEGWERSFGTGGAFCCTQAAYSGADPVKLEHRGIIEFRWTVYLRK